MTEQPASNASENPETPEEPDQPNPSEQPPEEPEQPTGFDALPEETKKEIRDLRRENARHRREAKEREDADKSEVERITGERDDLQSRLTTLEATYRDSQAEAAFIAAATTANARSPRTLFRAYKGDLDFDDDGTPTNIDAVLKTIQKDEPDLFQPTTGRGDGGKWGEPTDTTDFNSMIRQKAGRRG